LFNLETTTWDCIPQKVEFIIEDDVLGSGGFRTAYKRRLYKFLFRIQPYNLGCEKNIWILCKKKLKKIFVCLWKLEHTKQIVQMHALAKNIASQLMKKVKEEGFTTQYGETLKFKDVFFAKVDEECVTLEEFIEGEFVKYINNTGKACVPDTVGQKAQCLA
jgi:hypothetical protein